MVYTHTDTDKRLLVIMAHPDDAEILCFGGILYYQHKGYHVSVLVVCTKHTKGNGLPSDDIDRQRKQETVQAFLQYGIDTVLFGDIEDGYASCNTELISLVEKTLKSSDPDVVITHCIDSAGYDHQDHTAVGQAVLNASYRVPIPCVLHAEPHCIKSAFSPNFFIDITHFYQKKLGALQSHRSQQSKHYFHTEYQNTKHAFNALFYSRSVAEYSGRKIESYYCSHYMAP